MENLQAYLQSIETTIGPNVVGLSTRQRLQLVKMSDGTKPFVEKARRYMESNPEFAASYLGASNLGQNLETLQTLMVLKDQFAKMTRNLEDTVMTMGAQVYHQSREYYQTVKRAAHAGVPSAKPIYDDMKQRFVTQRRAVNSSSATGSDTPAGPPGLAA